MSKFRSRLAHILDGWVAKFPGSEWQRLAEAGRQVWEQRYRWEKIVEQYEVLYLRLCEARHVPGVR